MRKSKKVKAFKILLGIAVIGIIIVAIMYFFPVVKDLSSVEGQLAFQNKFKNSGIGGILALFGLQVAQIFSESKKNRMDNVYFIFNTRNTKRFVSIYSRVIANKTNTFFANCNFCKISISNYFYLSRR